MKRLTPTHKQRKRRYVMKKLTVTVMLSMLLFIVVLSLGQAVSTPDSYPVHEVQKDEGRYFNVGIKPTAVVSGDFCVDTIPDLAVANHGSNTVSIICFNANNTPILNETINVGMGPEDLAVGDFNNDGRQDLVVVNQLSNNAMVLLGDGKGHFTVSQTVALDGNGVAPVAVAVGDFDRDSLQDFIVANRSNDTVVVVQQKPAGTFTPLTPTNIKAKGGQELGSITVGDFTRDGILDFAVTAESTNNVVVGIGPLVPGPPAAFHVVPVGLKPVSIAPSFGWGYLSYNFPRLLKPILADFNRDGCQDLVVTNYGERNQGSSISVLLGIRERVNRTQGGKTFTGWVCTGDFQPAINYQTDGNGPSSVVVGDFNGDAMDDIAVINQLSNSLTIMLNQCKGSVDRAVPNFDAQCCTISGNPPTVRNCQVNFKIVKKYTSICRKVDPDPCDPYAMVLFDKDRDGIGDLAITCKNSEHPQQESSILVTHGMGDGSFFRPPKRSETKSGD